MALTEVSNSDFESPCLDFPFLQLNFDGMNLAQSYLLHLMSSPKVEKYSRFQTDTEKFVGVVLKSLDIS